MKTFLISGQSETKLVNRLHTFALILLLLSSSIACAQAGPPYDVCNNKGVSMGVIVYVSKGGTVSQWGPVTIGANLCSTVPGIHFTNVGHVPGNLDCEVEVVVVEINSMPYNCPGGPGGEPICSSAAPTGFPCSIGCPPQTSPPEKCCNCFGSIALISMAWSSSKTDLW